MLPWAPLAAQQRPTIQYAIDALEHTGGTVRLDKGNYLISAPVRLGKACASKATAPEIAGAEKLVPDAKA